MWQDAAIIVAIITALIGPIVTGVVVHLRTRRVEGMKADAEVAKMTVDQEVSVSGVVLTWAQHLNLEIANLKTEVKTLRDEIDTLHKEVWILREHNRLLIGQVLSLGAKPVEVMPYAERYAREHPNE